MSEARAKGCESAGRSATLPDNPLRVQELYTATGSRSRGAPPSGSRAFVAGTGRLERLAVRSRTGEGPSVPVNTCAESATNPLAGMPSILAIRDLRRRIQRSIQWPLSQSTVLRLLRLDPPTVLRAMRAAAAPIYRTNRDFWTIDAIADALGSSLTRRALDVPAVDVTGTSRLRRLWLHAVASAHGARMLANATGLLDPDEAYVAGLVHDLPLWLDSVGRRHNGAPPPGEAREWMGHWGMPRRLVGLILDAGRSSPVHQVMQPDSPAALVASAEVLAELADFAHPDEGDAATRDRLLDRADRSELLAAQRLRREVEADLREVGLDLAVHEPELDLERLEFQDEVDRFAHRPPAETVEIVLSILSCSKAGSYRGIVTASTAAALRYLGFDRAFYVKWIRATGCLAVRAKADMSARRVRTVVVEPTLEEHDEFGRALAQECPVRLAAVRNGGAGLLHLIGADEAVAVPVSREFATPSFLVLDRSLSARPIHMLREADFVTTLAVTTSILNENLLLKRRRQRAQKFALTDPLTHLFNRRMGIANLDQEVARAQRQKCALTILMIDLDDFKRLNDRHGHLQGDLALRATAEVLRKTMRKSDTVCRYGGEEFLVVLPNTNAEDSAILAARLFTAVEERGREMGLPVTVSIGQASIRPGDSAESLLQRADKALYASKSLGRNRFSVDADLE